MAHGLGHLADDPAGVLGDLNHVLAGLQQLLRKCSREHRIGIVVIVRETIERGLPGTGGEHREHAFRQLRHRREPAAAGDRAGACPLERIVAAGIEHQDGGAHLLVLQPLDDAVGQNGGVAHQFFLALGRGRHVGRQQEILARDFKAVAGIEEERGIAGLDRLVERQQRFAERLAVLVLRHHHRKAELLEGIAHGAGVVDRLLQFWNVLVVIVADHQRDALFRVRGRGERQQRRSQAQCSTRPRTTASSSSLFPALHDVVGGPCEPLAWSAKALPPVQSSAAARLLHTRITGPAKFSASAHSATRTFTKAERDRQQRRDDQQQRRHLPVIADGRPAPDAA